MNFRDLLTTNSQNAGSGYIMKPPSMVWMGRHQRFDFITKDLNFHKNRLCTGKFIFKISGCMKSVLENTLQKFFIKTI